MAIPAASKVRTQARRRSRPADSPAAPVRDVAAHGLAEEEHRVGTLLFADVVNSTGILTSHGAETALARMDEAIGLASECVVRFGGTVNRITGDGVMAMFGAPAGMAEHALAACSAALDLHARLVGARHRIAIRVGIHSGEFLVHPLRVPGLHALDATGSAVNLAARLQQAAGPEETLISGATHAAAGARLIADALPAIDLRGFDEPQTVFRLTGSDLRLTRFETALNETAQYVGRGRELTILADRMAAAMAGAGSALVLQGDAGIGKTRLVQQVAATAPAGVQFVALQARRWRRETALHPFESMLRAATHLDVSLAGAADWDTLQPSERRARLVSAVVEETLRRADDAPVVVIVDDMHWADEATILAIETMLPRIADRKMLLLLLTRPGYQLGPLITSLPSIDLEPLSQLDAAELAGSRGLDAGLAASVAARSGGNPFFIEQAAAVGTALPPDVWALLTERVDQLPARTREVLRRIAVIEQPVTQAQLATALAPEMSPGVTRKHVHALEKAGLVAREGLGTAASIAPRHALLQEAVYRGLTQRRRRERHAWVARRIASQPDAHPDMLARHAWLGALWSEALQHNEAAARRALSRFANREAVTFIDRALDALANLPATPALLDRAIDLRLLLRDPLFRLGESVLLGQRLAEAVALAQTAGDHPRIPSLWIFQIHHAWLTGQFAEAERILLLAEQCAVAEGDEALALRCVFQRGMLDLARDRHAPAAAAMAAVARDAADTRHGGRYGLDAALRVVALGYQSRMLADMGMPAEAREVADACLAAARAVGRPFSWVFAVLADGYALHCAGRSAEAVACLAQALPLCEKAESDLMRVAVLMLLGIAEHGAGDLAAACSHLEKSVDLANEMCFVAQQPLRLTMLARALAARGDTDAAARRLADAARLRRKFGMAE